MNIGLIILHGDRVDLRVTNKLDRIKSISAALDKQIVLDIFSNIKILDSQNQNTTLLTDEMRIQNLSRIGPLTIAEAGNFIADSNSAYEERVTAIMNRMVDPEPPLKRRREKKTRLYSQIKRVLRDEKILAKKDEGLESHRVVAGYEVDEGLVADLVLKNGIYHVVETVDASGDESSFKKAVAEIAVSALVIERARMRFGNDATKARLVYSTSASLERLARPSLDAAEHQGIELVNWASGSDRSKFIHTIAPLAQPLLTSSARKVATLSQTKIFH